MNNSIFSRIKESLNIGETRPESRNQVVVLGSNLSGAFGVATAIDEDLDLSGLVHTPTTVEKDAAYIEEAILGTDPDNPNIKPTIPFGVVLLSEMRQYYDGRGMTIRSFEDKDLRGLTIYDHVRKICKKYDIPLECIEQRGDSTIDPNFLGKIALRLSKGK